MALQGVILYLLVLFPAALLIEDSPNSHPDGPPITCGRLGSEKLLRKKSSNSICCGDEQYSPDTHCCCWDGALRTEARGCSRCCEQDKNQAPLACCGQRPFDPSSAVCCGLKILAHPLRCCGGGAYHTNTQLCCGPLGREKILSKKHEENICCGDGQYSNGTHECLGDPPRVKERPVSPGTRSDRASIPRPAEYRGIEISFQSCGQGAYHTNTQLCCGPLGREKILSKEHEENICCGDGQYSNGTHECLGDPPRVKERPVSPGTRSDRAFIPMPAEYRGIEISFQSCGQGAYHTNTQLCCGPLGREKILSKEHEENICCGDAQYSNGTHECLGDPPRVKERPVSPGTRPVSPGTRSDRATIPRPADSSALPVSSVMAEQLAPSTVNLPVAEPGGRPRVRVSGRGPADPPDSRGTGPAPSSPSPWTRLRGMLFRSGRS
ncbi:galaxin-like isoform X2 [Gadus chalcogrammus]|nr:galaxin-like isoform X2 [Gadus chalcogrammus]XP_056467254.1 galaxin-like isoform X2 [Gadus chalcogrammus]XP_056467255.1 galaxin-like isoform X2 [Gadus chalcogrammus]